MPDDSENSRAHNERPILDGRVDRTYILQQAADHEHVSRCVLIVDDEADNLQITAVGLRLFGGWTVLTAESGEDALQLAREIRPDVILLDHFMPTMSGCEVLENLRQDQELKEIPVLFYTGDPQGLQREAGSLDGVGVIAKPLNPKSIGQALEIVLQG